ncbi:MAG: class I SAM-dependent methyltransferase [Stellaceae bacterium]
MQPQATIDAKNAEFWDELCGTLFARELGIHDRTQQSLQRFDEAYLAFYSYLASYAPPELVAGKRVLEIGLGYGTLGGLLASRGAVYHGLDLARGPVEMMRYRLSLAGVAGADDRVKQGSALAIPFPDASFDFVYSIGCLHHTGDTTTAVSEVRRVLIPGGRAVVMLYNRHSFRQVVQLPIDRLKNRIRRRGRDHDAFVRGAYDANTAGDAAPHTDFVSRRDIGTCQRS